MIVEPVYMWQALPAQPSRSQKSSLDHKSENLNPPLMNGISTHSHKLDLMVQNSNFACVWHETAIAREQLNGTNLAGSVNAALLLPHRPLDLIFSGKCIIRRVAHRHLRKCSAIRAIELPLRPIGNPAAVRYPWK